MSPRIFDWGTDRKVPVRALSENNPKQFDNVKTYYALFQGTLDLVTRLREHDLRQRGRQSQIVGRTNEPSLSSR